jgi:hypothetical protein
MKDFPRLFIRLLSVFLSSALCACIVVPKQVTSYGGSCMLTTRQVELTIEQSIHHINCSNDYCNLDIADELAISAFLFATSAIVSGSIALAGNTLYWLERQGNCANPHQQKKDIKETQEDTDEKYLIHEEIITAKS